MLTSPELIRAIVPRARRLREEAAPWQTEAGRLRLEADAAAAEAAREAKAEVLERAVKVESADTLPARPPRRKPPGRARSRSGPSSSSTSGSRTFNSVEFGIYKHSRNRAKSRQFTTDMDIFAEVIEKGERTGLLGYREDLWKKNTGMDKRLVFKLFNETVNWRATMDLMIGRSLQLTLGARGLPVTCFSLNVGDHDNMVYLERSANKWPLLPENFSFFLLEDGKPQFYRLRRDFIDLGGDYTLYNHHNQAIGCARRQGVLDRRQVEGPGQVRACRPAPADRAEAVLRHADLQRRCRRHMRTLARDDRRRQVHAQAREAGSRPLHEPAPGAL